MKKNVVTVLDGEIPPQNNHSRLLSSIPSTTLDSRSSMAIRRVAGGRRGRRGLSVLSASFSIMTTAGVLLVGLGERNLLGGWRQGPDSSGSGSPLACGLAYASVATTMAAEVQGNGEILEAVVTEGGGGGGGGGSGVGKGRVSSDARTRFPVTIVEEQPARMVVIGDVHGDVGAFAETLRAAGLVDGDGKWSAGETVLVQAGDIFDRGDADLEVEEWLWTLQEQASASGGAVYHLLGNHEIMNAIGDHSTASPESFKPFLDLDIDLKPFGDQLDKFPDWVRPRLAAMAPSGPVAKMLASHSVAMKIGDTLFVHGGLRPVNLMPENCRGETGMACLESLNRWTHEWLLGKAAMPQKELWNSDSPVWSRYYSQPGGRELDAEKEAELQKVLDATDTVRMIVGHTPQEAGINSALGGRLWRTDTGMTGMIGGHPEALEIVDGVATILSANGRIPGEERSCKMGRSLPPLPSIPEKHRKGRPGRLVDSSVNVGEIEATATATAA